MENPNVQQVKLFKTIEGELSVLEKEFNDWVRQSDVRILSVTGNIAPQSGGESNKRNGRFTPSDVLLVVLYETDSA